MWTSYNKCCTLKEQRQFINILKKELSGKAWRNGDEM